MNTMAEPSPSLMKASRSRRPRKLRAPGTSAGTARRALRTITSCFRDPKLMRLREDTKTRFSGAFLSMVTNLKSLSRRPTTGQCGPFICFDLVWLLSPFPCDTAPPTIWYTAISKTTERCDTPSLLAPSDRIPLQSGCGRHPGAGKSLPSRQPAFRIRAQLRRSDGNPLRRLLLRSKGGLVGVQFFVHWSAEANSPAAGNAAQPPHWRRAGATQYRWIPRF
jgi:hypothetical protein